MTERQSLFAVFSVIYLSECLLWVRRGGVLFRRGLGRWTAKTGSEAIRNDRGDLHWAWPLPPFGDVAVSHGLPFSIGTTGVLNATAAAFHPSGRPVTQAAFLLWEDIRTVEAAGRSLRLNGSEFWKSDSTLEPVRLGRLLGSLRRLDAPALEPALRTAIATAFDTKRIRARLAAAESAVRHVRTASTALAALLFLVAPAAITRFGWLPPLFWLVPGMFALTGTIAWMALRAHRDLYPDAGDERFRLALMLALSPAAAIRAVDPVQRPLLEEFHPLAVASVLLEGADFTEFAAPTWRDLRFPRLPECPVETVPARETEQWFRNAVITEAGKTVRAVGQDPDAWERPPAKSDPSHALYCPRCQSQFTKAATACRECGGRALLELA